jgi:hypothetical protein
MASCKITWIVPNVPELVFRIVRDELESGHHLTGCAAAGQDMPFLFFRTSSPKHTVLYQFAIRFGMCYRLSHVVSCGGISWVE